MTTKRYLCQCWLNDMNYAEFEAFALVEITPELARKLLVLIRKIEKPVLRLDVDDATPQWFRDVDVDELDLAVDDLSMGDTYPLADGQVAMVLESERLDASGVYCTVTPDGVSWTATLEDWMEESRTAQFPLDLLVRIGQEE